MSTQLENNLRDILNEKNTKIIPENIKSGVNIFNVTGIYEGSINMSKLNQQQICDLVLSDDGSNYSFGIVTIPINGQSYTGGALCPNLHSQNFYSNAFSLIQTITNFDTSNAINMCNMFTNFNALTTVPNFNTSNVTNMCDMFSACRNLVELANFNTINVTNMADMFYYCENLINVPSFNTSNVTNMADMFYYCKNLVELANFNTINVTNMASMFFACCNLINVPDLNTINVTNMADMFVGCNNLSDASIQNIVNMCLNSNITNSQLMNLSNEAYPSPFRGTNISNTRYQNRWSELTAAGWTY